MKKLFLIAIACGLLPFLALAQFTPQSVIPRSTGGGGVGTNTIFIAKWEQAKRYENTTTSGVNGFISAVYTGTNTYILDSSTVLCTSSAAGAGPTGTGTLITDGTCKWNFSVAGQNIKTPINLIAMTKIETIAGGGGGDNGGSTNTCTDYITPCGGAGGGGAYSVVTSGSFAANTNYQYQVGTGGVGGVSDGTINVGHFGTNGTSSWFNGTTCGGSTICSLPGAASTIAGPGAGGANSGGVGTQTAGGAGGKLFQCCSVGAGGGGAGGPKGAGLAGGNTDNTGSPVGAGGGGGGGGSVGAVPVTNSGGGAGGNNWQSTGGGLGSSVVGFTTAFPGTENPISQSGKWQNGSAGGNTCIAFPNGGPGGSTQCWGNVQVASGKATGIGVNDPTQFGDATAVVTAVVASWTGATDQMATMTVRIPGAQPSADFQEVELRLNTVISAGVNRGYEMNCSVTGSPYTTLVRWNGPNANATNSNNGYTSLASGPAVTCQDGDEMTLANIGGTIYGVINRSGTAIAQVSSPDFTGTLWTGGAPGLGFYNNTGSANYTNFGINGFSIPTPPTNGAGGGGGGGATPRPGAAIAGNGSCGYEFDNSGTGNSLYGAGGGGGGGAGYDTGAAFPAGAFSTIAFASTPGNGMCGSGGGEGGNASDVTGGQVTGGNGGNGFIAFSYSHS